MPNRLSDPAINELLGPRQPGAPNKGAARLVREWKRWEAEERNTQTPEQRIAAHRRRLEAAAA